MTTLSYFQPLENDSTAKRSNNNDEKRKVKTISFSSTPVTTWNARPASTSKKKPLKGILKSTSTQVTTKHEKENTSPSNTTPSVCQPTSLAPRLLSTGHGILSTSETIEKKLPPPQRVLRSSTPCSRHVSLLNKLDPSFHPSMSNGKKGLPAPQRVLQTPRHISNLEKVPGTPLTRVNYSTSSTQLNPPSTLKKNQLSAQRVLLPQSSMKTTPAPRRVLITPSCPIPNYNLNRRAKDPMVAILNFDTPPPLKGDSKLLLKPEKEKIELSREEKINVKPFLGNAETSQRPSLENHTEREVIEVATRSVDGSYEEMEGNESDLDCSITALFQYSDMHSPSCSTDAKNNNKCNNIIKKEEITEETAAAAERVLQNCAAEILNQMVDKKSVQECTISSKKLEQLEMSGSLITDPEPLQVFMEHHVTIQYRKRIVSKANSELS